MWRPTDEIWKASCRPAPLGSGKNSDPPPNLVLKKTVAILAFRVSWTLEVKILWFGRQVAVCVQKRHKNAIFGCSWFQKFNIDCLLLKLLICSFSHLSWFQGPKDIPPSFWPWVTNHDVKSKKKKDFLGHCSYTQIFYDVENLRRKPKIFVKVTQRFWYVQHTGWMF